MDRKRVVNINFKCDGLDFDAAIDCDNVLKESLGKPADDNAMQRKLEWLDKVGTHNMEGIFKYLRNENKVQRG